MPIGMIARSSPEPARRPGKPGRRRELLPLLAAATVLGVLPLAGTASAGPRPVQRPEGTYVTAAAARQGAAVRESRYDLGDQAFAPTPELGYEGRSEVAATVYRPADLGSRALPLVVMEHGSWETCADAGAAADRERAVRARDRAEAAGDQAEAERQNALIERAAGKLWAWPCATGTRQIPSSSGYDYLGRALAARGFVVVSVGVNGLNSTEGGQAPTAYRARALLVEHHLKLWQRLATRGEGPLAHALTDTATGRPDPVDFRGHLDLKHVGLLGHSMGGGGVMQEVSDDNPRALPGGVRIAAAFTLAPTATWDFEAVTGVPFAVMWGTCDAVNTGSYFEHNRATTRFPAFKYTLTGGNHDFYNRQWSPDSGQVASRDDAVPGSAPGTCLSQYEDRDRPRVDQPRMTAAYQRLVTTNRVSAFFQRFLRGRDDLTPRLTGDRPFPGEGRPGRVSVEHVPGTGSGR